MKVVRTRRSTLDLLLCILSVTSGCTGDSVLLQQPPDYYAESARDGRQVLEPIEGR